MADNPIFVFINGLPVVTRALFGCTVVISVLGNFVFSPHRFILLWPLVIKKLEIWRLLSCFFFGKMGFNWALTLYFLYQHSLDLERNSFTGRTADYVWFLCFTGVACLIGSYFLDFIVLFEPLVLAVVYLWAQHNAASSVSFMFGMRFKAMFLPWVLVAWDLVLTGAFPIAKLMGIVVGHIFYYINDLYPAANNGRRGGVFSGVPGRNPIGGSDQQQQAAPGPATYIWGRGQRLG